MIKKLKARLVSLQKQEADFDSDEIKKKVETLGPVRLLAEQDRQNILASIRGEQFAIKKMIEDLESANKEVNRK